MNKLKKRFWKTVQYSTLAGTLLLSGLTLKNTYQSIFPLNKKPESFITAKENMYKINTLENKKNSLKNYRVNLENDSIKLSKLEEITKIDSQIENINLDTTMIKQKTEDITKYLERKIDKWSKGINAAFYLILTGLIFGTYLTSKTKISKYELEEKFLEHSKLVKRTCNLLDEINEKYKNNSPK